MSREILYRAKAIKDNEWVQGAYCHYDDIKDNGKDDCDYIIEKHNGEYFPFREIIPETVGQFTGLTDKNGKKIFEGDIVKDGAHTFKVCYYDYGWFCYCISSKGYILPLHKYFRIGQWDNCENNDFRKLEVIGNIHDNPELMEKTK